MIRLEYKRDAERSLDETSVEQYSDQHGDRVTPAKNASRFEVESSSNVHLQSVLMSNGWLTSGGRTR